MSVARDADGTERLPNVVPARMNGRVDALDGNRLHGWIWDEARPEERLRVRLMLDGRVVAEVVADQGRIDLRRNGIGDGRHAFSMELDDATVAVRERLVILGLSPATGTELELRLPPPAELAAEAAIAVPLARFFDRVEALIALNRRGQLAQKELVEKLDEVTERLGGNSVQRDEAAETARADHISQRLSELDVFLMRFDTTMRGFDERLIAIRKEAQRPLRQATMLLGFMSGLAALMSFVTLAVTLARH
ncbi:hypothetical protein DWF00_23710 [Bosea caraganae]|uniref:Uncharacterized protein n=1 Tax=Bosea caraganae TaxID=2763117 RepID=A0A370L287_9HYPH|nr:hypothetical protein [Bosea caraganae]RDJ22151.1 hypothetical protein DWE98_19835 [Bosea caraganae]RDJ22762.1 hypothetical protein DWF00_23710 [Bosea caraganae]